MAPPSPTGELQADGDDMVLAEIRGLAALMGQALPAQEGRLQVLCEQVAAIARTLESQSAEAAQGAADPRASERQSAEAPQPKVIFTSGEGADDSKARGCNSTEPSPRAHSRADNQDEARFHDTRDAQGSLGFVDSDSEEAESFDINWGLSSVEEDAIAATTVTSEVLRAQIKRRRHKDATSTLRISPSTVQRWRETSRYGLLVRLHDKLKQLEEPKRTGLLARILSGSSEFIIVVILSNAFWMAWSANYEAGNPTEDTPSEFFIIEIAYLFMYILELVLRLSVHRWYFFCNEDMGWNVTDFCIVLYSIMELVFLEDIVNRVSFLRTLRLLRAAKILRLFRVIRFLSELRVMLLCLLGSLTKFGWSMVMMFLTFYMFSMVFLQGVVTYRSADQDSAMDPVINDAFGSLQKCLLTLFKMSTGESWVLYYEAMVRVGDVYASFLIFFVAFSQIALLNVLTGIFVENAMKNAEPGPEQKAEHMAREKLKQADDLEKLVIRELGLESEDELFDVGRLMLAINGTILGTYLYFLGVDTTDIHSFMNLEVEMKGEKFIDTQAFVTACMRVKGSATCLDMQHVLLELRVLRKDQASTLELIRSTLEGRGKRPRFEKSVSLDPWARQQKSSPPIL